jgi:hypothetical protein
VDDVYGGTNRYFSQCATRFGIEVDFVDATDLALFEKAIKPNTKVSCNTGQVLNTFSILNSNVFKIHYKSTTRRQNLNLQVL